MNTDKELLETMSATLNNLCVRAIHYDEGDPKRIQHLIKVHYFARLIGICEQVAPEVLFILEAAALVHDIGIPVCGKIIMSAKRNMVPATASIKNSKVRR